MCGRAGATAGPRGTGGSPVDGGFSVPGTTVAVRFCTVLGPPACVSEELFTTFGGVVEFT